MPDLGQYAFTVLFAYGGALAMLAGLLVASVLRARRIARLLKDVEERRKS